MIICPTIDEVRTFTSRNKDKTISLVPTMGFLHEGHLQLVDIARQNSDLVVVSIYVNPTQFGPNEDLDRYPRDFEGDRMKLVKRGVDAVFYPESEMMYPDNYHTYVEVEKLDRILCGASRPGHFKGVTTVVAKLFNIVQPHVAVFGEKDFQQLTIIKRMVKDLNIPVKIIGGSIIRENDGLAMSSRNKYLNPDERKQATILNKSLGKAAEHYLQGEKDTAKLKNIIINLISKSPLARIDYVEFVDSNTLETVKYADEDTRILVAVFFGKTRLIDNVSIAKP